VLGTAARGPTRKGRPPSSTARLVGSTCRAGRLAGRPILTRCGCSSAWCQRDDDARDIGERSLPNDLAGFLVGGDNAPRTVTGGDDEVAPQCDAAALALLLLLGVHAPHNATDVARPAVDLAGL
jgi:hypothetical protein